MKKQNIVQENSKRQFNELRNKFNKGKEYFTKEIEALKRNTQKKKKKKERKNSTNNTDNALENIRNRTGQKKKKEKEKK